jgi:pimeloyl-ACP methyl ester carboxylesterase
MQNSITPPERQSAIKLKDGRTLGWHEWGPTNGTPILFCTGAAMSGHLGFGIDALSQLGLRLLAIDRPGLGCSTYNPNKSLASWADDVENILKFIYAKNIHVVGFSQGAPFALALAARGLTYRVAIVSGQDQLYHSSMRPLLIPDVQSMLNTIEQDPDGFERHVIDTFSLEQMWNMVMGMNGERDREVYESPAFKAAYRRALEDGFSQGAKGYARDLILALTNWGFDVETLRLPIDLWYGRLDTSPVHSPDFGVTLANRLPQASLHILDDEGGSLLWTRSHEILETLISH